MSVAYIGQAKAKDGEAENLKTLYLTVVAPALDSAHGCESFQLFQSQEDPGQFIGIEVWDSVESHRASVKHISPDDIAKFRASVENMHGSYHSILHQTKQK